jgi:competence protein ComEC
MLWAAVTYSVGILFGAYAWRPAVWWVVGTVAFLAATLYFAFRRPGLGWLLGLATFFLAGALNIQLRNASPRLDTSILPYADHREVVITAYIKAEGRIQPGDMGELRQTVDVESELLQTAEGEIIPVHSGVRLNIYSAWDGKTLKQQDIWSYKPTFQYGERIRFLTKLRHARNFRNPGAFDYEGYLADRGVAALGSAKLENVERLSGFAGNRLERLRSRVHRSVIAKVHELWPAREAALIDAMVIGEEAFIDRDTRADFQRSGTYHILVVSGMNVSILAFVVFWTLRRLRTGEIAATMLTVVACVGYALITEVGAPVWRATLMCAVYLGTRLLYRDRAMTNALGAAALGLLIFDPRQLFTASFQMTFLCVLIVAAIGLPMLDRTSQLFRQALTGWDSARYAAMLPPRVAQFRLDLQIVSSRLALFVGESRARRIVAGATRCLFASWDLLFISAVMQAGLALPMAYYFHRATTIGLPANLTVVPLTEIMMPAAVASLALGYMAPWLAKLPVLVTTFALEGITGTIQGLAGLRLADLRIAMPSAAMMAITVLFLLLAIWSARRRFWLTVGSLIGLFVAALSLAIITPRPHTHPAVIELTAIDVGQGDSVLVVTATGKTLLVDAGGPIGPGGSQLDFGEDVVSPYLWERGITHLDAVAISHGHSDHMGGMAAVVRNFRPKELWIGLLPPSRPLESLIFTAQMYGVKVVRHWEGDAFEFGGSEVRVLFPPRDWPVGDRPQNSDSMVLSLTYGQSSLLLEGDAETRTERYICGLEHPKATVLKVGHHGSANATSQELINAATPEFAIISVGSGNSFGLPRYETLARLASAGTRVYRTDLDGAVTFYLDGRSVTAASASLQ